MNDRRLIDTNVIVRHVVQDHAEPGQKATRLFRASDKREIDLVILSASLAESVFVLESFYRCARTDIASALSLLLTSPGVEIADLAIHLDALERYRKTKAHFIDCLLAATAVASGARVASFDTDFMKFEDVTVRND